LAWLKNIFGFLSFKDKDPFFVQMHKLTGIRAKNIALYKLAFKHKSKNQENNERLEFLGDSILDAIISEIIYNHFPNKDEGELSKLRSKMVSRNMLNTLGNNLNLLSIISYRETHTKDGLNNTVGNALEALIGAVYLDQGYPACQVFIEKKLVDPYIDWHQLEAKVTDHKSSLFRYCQKEKKHLQFVLLEENAIDDPKRFHIGLKIDYEQVADAFGKSKKIAEQCASKVFLDQLTTSEIDIESI
jgi:ribonuclease-3